MISFVHDLAARPWTLWLLLAIVAAIVEVSLPSFTFAFVSIAALVAMIVSFNDTSWIPQTLSFVAALFVTVTFVRPRFLARFQKSHHMPSRSQALVGLHGEVIEAIDPVASSGRVLVNGQDWAARASHQIASGRTVRIEGHDGIILIVKEI